MNCENLLHLVETLQLVQERDAKQGHSHFDMGTWAETYGKWSKDGQTYTPPPKPSFNNCGTVACALGWEAMTRYANKRGLRLLSGTPVFDDDLGVYAAVQYFSLHARICDHLFLPQFYMWEQQDSPKITPQDVIDRVTLLLAIGEKDFLSLCFD